MTTVWVIKYRSKTRRDDQVRSQPWHIDSVWEDRGDAKRDMQRQEAENGDSHDFDLEEVDFYRKGTEKK